MIYGLIFGYNNSIFTVRVITRLEQITIVQYIRVRNDIAFLCRKYVLITLKSFSKHFYFLTKTLSDFYYLMCDNSSEFKEKTAALFFRRKDKCSYSHDKNIILFVWKIFVSTYLYVLNNNNTVVNVKNC